ncbi:MAG: hypothetical protein C0467_21500 [Planctomycetaceae bacterium]|nr:hypothetical protein [Planctomycetaceae bacterium]
MQNESSEREWLATGDRPRLPATVFYGVLLAGVLLGFLACGGAAWAYLEAGEREPTGRRIWGDVAKEFVVPIALMIGSTFGGLSGFAFAVLWDRRISKRSSEM